MTEAAGDIATQGLVASTWTIDNAHSEVSFTVRHLMSKVRGRFTELSGEIVTGTDPADAKVNATIKLDSINTNQGQRDDHLRSSDFFEASSNPEMSFASTAISGDEDGYVITGDLTIKGVTRSVDLQAEFLGVAVDAFGVTRLGAEASTSINRKDFGIDFNIPLDGGKFLIGDKIDIALTIEATQGA